MTDIESKLTRALEDFLAIVGGSASGAVPDSERFTGQLRLIEQLGSQLPHESRELRHFIEKHSFQKALDLLLDGAATRGTCR